MKQRGVGCAAARDADSAEGRAIYQRAVGHRQPGQSPQRPQDRHGSGPIQMLTWWSGFQLSRRYEYLFRIEDPEDPDVDQNFFKNNVVINLSKQPQPSGQAAAGARTLLEPWR